jgi:hypothetical protein
MFDIKLIRRAAILTLFFFAFFTFAADLAMARPQEDDLTKAKRLYQEGDYEGSIKLLSGFIDKLKAMVEQKKNVAEAFYLLAKIYFEVGDDAKVEENLGKVFTTYPSFTKKDEANFGFKERVDKARAVFLKDKEAQARQMEQELKEQEKKEPEVIKETKPEAEEFKVIEQPKPKKKKKKFPVLLVVGGLVVVAALVLLLGKKKKDEPAPEVFDIRGTWRLTATILGETFSGLFTFSGNLNNGTFVDEGGDTGTYTVNGRNVSFSYDDYLFSFTGRFIDQNRMEGTFELTTVEGTVVTGNWHGDRQEPVPGRAAGMSITTTDGNPFFSKKNIKRK